MLNVTVHPAAFDPYVALRGTTVPSPARRQDLVEARARARVLAQYNEGWAEADPVTIAGATAPGYHIDDPFVGTFSTLALPRYLGTLNSRSGLGALGSREHLAFVLRGPMDVWSRCGEPQFWREAPRLGLNVGHHRWAARRDLRARRP
jgi:hypothetical protein